MEYPETTANMVRKSRKKQLAVSSNESDTEPEGVYRHTRTRTGAVTTIDDSALAQDIEVRESHSAIAKSQASNCSIEKEPFVYMTYTSEQTTNCLE